MSDMEAETDTESSRERLVDHAEEAAGVGGDHVVAFRSPGESGGHGRGKVL
jgi:hypothetical protein